VAQAASLSREAPALASVLRGPLLSPGDPAYEPARRIWNAMIDRRPALIAQPLDAADIREAVRFGAERRVPVAIRGGGHNIAGTALCDDGLVIDCSRMKQVTVDAGQRTVHAEPGLTWGEFDAGTYAAGLATPGGIASTTGIAGFTLGGGFGWLTRKHGFTCDNLLYVDVVTSDGVLRRASAEENPDLFWAVRGGGGNFGAVTAFGYRVHPLGQVLGGPIVYPLAQARSVLRAWRDFLPSTPDELFVVFQLRQALPLPTLPVSIHGKAVLNVLIGYSGLIEEGENLLRDMRSVGSPVLDLVRAKPYPDHQRFLDPGVPPGYRNYWKSHYLAELSNAAIDTLVDRVDGITSPRSQVLIAHLGGAAARIPDEATALSHRDARFNLNVNSMWEEPGEDKRHIGWARSLWDAMQPFFYRWRLRQLPRPGRGGAGPGGVRFGQVCATAGAQAPL
jgi:hypothetical protein